MVNPLWGAPRIHGELLRLGIEVSQATVAKYMVRQHKPPSQTWRIFLNNHVKDFVATDFFVVPTLSSSFVCICRAGSSSASGTSFQRCRASNLGMDGTTNGRGLFVGQCSPLPAA